MRIIKYAMRLNEDRINCLVKESARNYPVDEINSPELVAKVINEIFDAWNQPEEFVWMVALDTARRIRAVFEVSHGTVGSSLVHPREIYTRAILSGAVSIILVHNHPSGTLSISEQDREVSQKIRQAGEILGIRLDDHIIIAGSNFVSTM